MRETSLVWGGVTKEEIRGHFRALVVKNEISVRIDGHDLYLSIQANGIISVSDDTYLHEGRKEFWARKLASIAFM